MLFWFSIVVTVDLHIEGVDLLHDVVGTIGVAFAVRMLAAEPADPTYQQRVRVAQGFAWLAVLSAVLTTVRFPGPLHLVLFLAGIAAPIALAWAMLRYAEVLGLTAVLSGWRRTYWLLAVLAGLSLAGLVARAPCVVLVAFGLVTLAQFLVAIWHTRMTTAPGWATAGRT